MFDHEAYIKKRKTLRLWGWITVIFALVDLVDSEYPFPVPLVGPIAIYVGVCILIAGIILLVMAYMPPNVMIVEQVAGKANGYITATLLIHYLGVSTYLAEKLVIDLFKKGYLDIVNKVTNETPIPQWVCQFVGVGKRTSESNQSVARDRNMNLGEYTQNNPEMSVDDINRMIFNNSMNVGSSGQPRSRR
jgi:hypothetical protein